MTLVPIEGMTSIGAALDLAQADPDGAMALVQFGLYEALCEQIDDALPRLDAAVSKAMTLRSDAARRALVRTYIGKRMDGEDVDELLAAAARLTVVDAHLVSKDSGDNPGTPWWDARDAGGRFVARAGSDKDINRVASNWRDTGFVEPGSQIVIHGTQRGRDVSKPEQMPDQGQWLQSGDPDFEPHSVSVHPRQANMSRVREPKGNQRRAFDFLNHFVGGRSPRAASRAPLERGQLQPALNDIMNTDRSEEGDRRSYRRIKATGNVLQQMSQPGSGAHAAGGLAYLLGDLGPEAERVLGRGIRRTAYRYRGTEKRPDAGLVRDVADADDLSSDPDAAQSQLEYRGGRRGPQRAQPKGAAGENPVGATMAAYWTSGRGSHAVDTETDQPVLRARGDAAVAYFLDRIPSTEKTRISIAAGRVPPSQGAIIDANGDVVSEAMGAAGDHYLPFDLRNLRRLNGGQYVRTRAMGGPTTEDIYTGLLSGARQVQVASNSGVFTVEFDPDLRGGRRYSDKARQMISRYERILDAIHNDSELYENDVDADTRGNLRRKAYEQVGGGDRGAVQDRYKVLLNEERLRQSFTGGLSGDALDTYVSEQIKTLKARNPDIGHTEVAEREREIRRKAVDQENENAVRRYRLDGAGYNAALESLKEEFPYFIRDVTYQPLRRFAEDRGLDRPGLDPLPGDDAGDKGYVPAGEINPGLRGQSFAADRRKAPGPAARVEAPASGGGGAPAPTGANAAATPGQQDAGARLPRAVSLPKKGEPLTKTLEGAKEDTVAELRAALSPAVPALSAIDTNMDPPEGVGETELLSYEPITAARTLAAKHASNFPGWLMNDASLDLVQTVRRGLQDAQTVINSDMLENPAAIRQRYPNAMWNKAKIAVDNALAVRQPFAAETPADPAMYDPGDDNKSALPLRFGEIDDLGADPARYEAFIEAAKQSDPPLAEAIEKMPDDPVSRANAVHQAVRAHKAALDYAGQSDPNAAVPRHLPAGVDNPAAAKQYASDPQSQANLLRMQAAWSFAHARDIAERLEGGGGSPKVGKRLTPTVLRSDTSTSSPIRKRQLLRHPYDSPVAKQWQELLRARSTTSSSTSRTARRR